MDPFRLTWLLPDGRAAGRTPEGRVARVPGALPGDWVRAVEDRFEIARPSEHRQEPACPVSDRCGGCDLDRLIPDARRQALGRMVGHAFGLDSDPPVTASPRQAGYRARIKLTLDGIRSGYRAPRSHEIVPVDACRIARPEVQTAHARLDAWLAEGPHRGLASVELRSDGSRVVYAFTSEGSVPRSTREALPALGDVALDGRRLAGDPVLQLTVAGHSLQARPGSFYQVNLEVNERMVAHVAAVLAEHHVERVLDLYAGIGNFTVPVAASGVPVVAVEAPGAAVDDLRANCPPNVEVHARRVERFDMSRVAFDGAVVDPPRAGTRGALARLAQNRPRVVVYVSCHPPSAAREIRGLVGYDLADLQCFELFVDTRHVEAVAVLVRRDR